VNPDPAFEEAAITPVEVVYGELVEPTSAAVATVDDVQLSETASDLVSRRLAKSTLSSYRNQWEAFERWCVSTGLDPLPCSARTLTNYAAHLVASGRAPNTVEAAVSGVRSIHRRSDYPIPVSEELTDLLITAGRDWADSGGKIRKARVLRPAELRAVLKSCDLSTARGIRDSALIAMSFQTGRRFSEIARMGIAEVRHDDQGLLYYVRRTKTDQTGAKARWQRLKPHADPALCVVRACLRWNDLLVEHGITNGPLLRSVDRHGRIGGEAGAAGRKSGTGQLSTRGAIDIWRAALVRAEIDPTGVSTHSARRSAVTAGHRAGRSEVELADRFGYKRGSTVMLGYIEDAEDEDTDPMAGIL
jgi:integrase